jgi:Na+-transporting NADH:ubiquinone oxidoreductase subunit C
MPDRTSNRKVLLVALVLSLICSAMVAVTTIVLRPMQAQNKWLYKQQNILKVAGLWQPGVSVKKQSGELETQLVDLQIGWFSDAYDPGSYDHFKAAKDPVQSIKLSREQDKAGIGRLANYAPVYMVRDRQGVVKTVVLPIYGYGLWSTLFGFVALDIESATVVGLTFYEHGDTPGLGGEIENPNWLAKWQGKALLDEYGNPVIRLVKGHVDVNDPAAIHQVDSLSGATLTARGVENLVHFWLGADGFGPFLQMLKLLRDEV